MLYRKRTQKDVTDAKVLAIWKEALEEARKLYPRYFETCEPELYIDNSYTHLGRCSWSCQNPSERNVDKIRFNRCIITISNNLGKDYEQIRKTICHELGHFVAPREKHGYLWKVRADKIGSRWGYDASRLSNNETFQQARKDIKAKKGSDYKYRLYCPHCGAEWKYKTSCDRIKFPQWYRCGSCKSSLKSEKI